MDLILCRHLQEAISMELLYVKCGRYMRLLLIMQQQISDAPPSYRSPSPEEHFTPDTRKPSNTAASFKSEDSVPATTGSAVKDTAASAAAAAPTYEEIKAKLAEAQATIAGYAQEGGLRLRKVAKGETENATVNDIANRVQSSQGVPVQIVAALCFMSFLLAYFFF